MGGVCQHTDNNNPCDDGQYCNGAEECVGGNCINGTSSDCNDNVFCTDDSYDPMQNDCVHVPNDSLCTDGWWCNGTETCDAVNDCEPGTPVDDGTATLSRV